MRGIAIRNPMLALGVIRAIIGGMILDSTSYQLWSFSVPDLVELSGSQAREGPTSWTNPSAEAVLARLK